MSWRNPWSMAKDTARGWSEHQIARLAASLAYYTLLSMAPLIVLAVAVVGLVYGQEAARGQIASQLTAIMGPEPAQGVETVVAHARAPTAGVFSSIVGIVTLLFGASGVFSELQTSLNTIWEVEPRPGRGVLGAIKDRFFSFTMVLSVAFLLLVSLVLTAALAAVGHVMERVLPGGEVLWQVVNVAFSFATITVLFALIFKVVPDVRVRWREVWVSGAITAALFTLGKFLLGLYLGKSSVSSAYGAAGSLVVLVIWVYYSAQILFIGAIFTRVYALALGDSIEPKRGAIRVEEREKRPVPAPKPHYGGGRPAPR